MAGITEYGFVRKTLPEIIKSLQDRLKSNLGSDWDTTPQSPTQQLVATFSAQLDEVWQGIEGVVSSQNINGAEGVYLDDLISQQGVFRRGKTKGYGEVIVFVDEATAIYGELIDKGRILTAKNNISYTTTSEKTVDNNMSCFKLEASQLVAATTYTFKFYNTSSPTTNTFTWTAGDATDIDNMLTALAQFANVNVEGLTKPAYYDTIDRVLYVGFDEDVNNLPLPMPKATLFVMTNPSVGKAGYRISAEANTAGFYPLNTSGILGISPAPTGFDSIVNWQAFSSGADVQTDAQYKATYENTDDASRIGTKPAIKRAVLNVDGVEDCEIYENPTKDSLYDSSSTLVCLPYTYNTVVLGGDEDDISVAIGSNAPVNVAQYGTTTISYTDEDGNVITTRFSKASYFNFAVNVDYVTKDGTYLTDVEKASISSLMSQFTSELDIGSVIPVEQFQAAVYRALPLGRLKSVAVQLKDNTNAGGSFVTSDLTTKFNQKPQLLGTAISYRKV